MRALGLFKGRHFDREISVLCVRWYLTYKLSSRDLVQMMAERGIEVTRKTILRRVQRFVPEFERRWNRYSRRVGRSWRCDETYIKVKGHWIYLYRAVGKLGSNGRLPVERSTRYCCCEAFLQQCNEESRHTTGHTLDAYAASHRAITELKSVGTIAHWVGIRSSNYLANVMKQIIAA